MNRVSVSILALSVVAHLGCRTRIGQCSEGLSSPPLLTPLPDHAGARDCRTGSASASADPSGPDKVLITQVPTGITEAKGAYPCEATRYRKFLPACTNLDRPVAVKIIYTYVFSLAER
jgi:hypothetical protein